MTRGNKSKKKESSSIAMAGCTRGKREFGANAGVFEGSFDKSPDSSIWHADTVRVQGEKSTWISFKEG